MVFVKVRETYDLHTVQNKMTVIGVHTPKPEILKRNYPGLLMQCRFYRPVSADVRLACASVEPLDPLGVGVSDGDVAPEDMFNPILYKAVSNFGMSQLEARINAMVTDPVSAGVDIDGQTAIVDVDSVTPEANEFDIYYGLLSNTHDWKHAAPQSGLVMNGLKPLVYEMLYNVGDNSFGGASYNAPNNYGTVSTFTATSIRGNAKPMPFINCTAYTRDEAKTPTGVSTPGFPDDGTLVYNAETYVPYLKAFCGVLVIPPSRLHSLYFRCVIEWTIEFSSIRPISEISDWSSLARAGTYSHYQNYSYETTKEALTGSSDSVMDSDSCMISANVDVNKVM